MSRSALLSLVAVAAIASAACGGGAPPRVVFLGVDGADPRIVDRLVAQGRLPHLAKLRAEGVYGPLRSREPMLSPILWTTMVTGRKGPDHGILDFVEPGPEGKLVPITSRRRRVAALWDVMREKRRRSGFIGWYGSFPAESVEGFQVSDRVGFHQVSSGSAATGLTYPEALAADLAARFGGARPDIAATKARFLASPGIALSADGEKRIAELAKLHATSEYYRRMAPWLIKEYQPELLGIYFELIDGCSHLFMEDAPPRRASVSDADFAAFGGTVDRCYGYQDEVLGDLLAATGPGTTTVVASDHGFKSEELRPRTSGRADIGQAPLWHRLHGVLFLHGPNVKPGAAIEGADILDVAPTILALLGIPSSRAMPGRVLTQAFGPDAVRDQERTASFPDPKPVGPASADAADPGRIEQLQALGYLGGAAAAHDAEGRTAASYLNEGISRAVDGEAEAALRAFERARAIDPKSVQARVYAARLLIQSGRSADARAPLDEALSLDPKNVFAHIQRANAALAEGRTRDAAASLVAAESLDPDLPHVQILKARVALVQSRPESALPPLDRAQALTDADALLGEIAQMRAQALRALGRVAEAESALGAAARVSPGPALAMDRADAALARNDAPAAVRLLEEALQRHQSDSALERKLGQALTAANREADAEEAFRRAVQKASDEGQLEGAYGDLSLLYQKQRREGDVRATLQTAVGKLPRSAALWGMLGAAWGRVGDLSQALSAYEKSVALKPTPLACKTLAALVFEERNDPARAVRLWRQSLALDPKQDDVRAFLKRHDPK